VFAKHRSNLLNISSNMLSSGIPSRLPDASGKLITLGASVLIYGHLMKLDTSLLLFGTLFLLG